MHFYHQEFERCRIVDKHMQILARKYFDTKFIKCHAPDLPFFVTKLNVQVLPCIIFFRNGVAYDRIVGFEELGAFCSVLLCARVTLRYVTFVFHPSPRSQVKSIVSFLYTFCLLYTSPSPRDLSTSRMPSSA